MTIPAVKDKYTTYSYLLAGILFVWVSANLNWGDGRWSKIVASDGNGYYAYLPVIFVYHDLQFEFIEEIKDDSINANINRSFVTQVNGHPVNKYFIGVAVCLIPFYAAGHLANIAFGLPLDGYAVYYRIFAQIGTIFYAMLGLFFMIKILRFYKFSDEVVALSVLAVSLGTNLFHYVVSEPMMSHIFSFAFVNLFVFSFLKYFKTFGSGNFLWGIIALGMVALIRPVNLLIIFSLPFLAQTSDNLRHGLKNLFIRWKMLGAGIVIFLSMVSIQLIIYKMQTGHFIVYSYVNEGFNFLTPHPVDFMFSYRKGFFVYTPVLFLSLFGFIYLYNDKFRFYSLLAFLGLVVYVLSSWWLWYYGGSFSQRVMIEYSIYFFILFSLLLQKSRLKKFLTPLIFLLIIVCQIQTYQYLNGYIHWSEMNKERYWDNFLRIDKVINRAEKEWE